MVDHHLHVIDPVAAAQQLPVVAAIETKSHLKGNDLVIGCDELEAGDAVLHADVPQQRFDFFINRIPIASIKPRRRDGNVTEGSVFRALSGEVLVVDDRETDLSIGNGIDRGDLHAGHILLHNDGVALGTLFGKGQSIVQLRFGAADRDADTSAVIRRLDDDRIPDGAPVQFLRASVPAILDWNRHAVLFTELLERPLVARQLHLFRRDIERRPQQLRELGGIEHLALAVTGEHTTDTRLAALLNQRVHVGVVDVPRLVGDRLRRELRVVASPLCDDGIHAHLPRLAYDVHQIRLAADDQQLLPFGLFKHVTISFILLTAVCHFFRILTSLYFIM